MGKREHKTGRAAERGRGLPYVVVVGGANIDIKVAIKGATIQGTSNPGTATVSVGGVGRNIAHNLARLGVPVRLISAVGRDPEGDRLIEETAAAGVDVNAVRRSAGATGVYSAVLDRHGELVIGISAMDVVDEITQRFLGRNRATIAGAAFLVADCNLQRSSLQWLQQCAKQSGVPFVVEPVSAVKVEKLNAVLRRGAALHTVTPNLQQLETLTGRDLRSLDATQHAARVLHDRGVLNVLVGLGAEGALISTMQGDGVSQHYIPAAQAKPQDVTGGGDAHVAGYVAGLLGGMRPLQAALLGQAAAGLTVGAAETVSRKMSMKNLTQSMSALKRRVKEL
ncbi:carbohydrate kinase family protein [Dongia sedimenti]|uniref:Carbohydrate kinase family protein n=1 Tax=Dongia sedimenti TaxID=3064282 RepID=A0ABU0YHF1_9PROT|nr:carbohydrate kinase family protein [Rhodospirillaceae bacterium R-7]